MKKQTAIYVRASRSDDGGKHPLTSQIAECKHYVTSKGLDLYKIYLDNPPGTIHPQNVLQELLDDVSDGKIDTLVLPYLTRLVRSDELLDIITTFLEENNVKIVTLS
jgi:DNA invertase Pin-like site-specific DNA recombinase